MEVRKSKKLSKVLKVVVIAIAALVFIAAVVASIYLYKQNLAIKQDPNTIAQQETAQLVGKVGKLMDLPTDETPSVATVTDKEKLKTQAFFTKSENGDKVLIYTNAKQAILYRPSTNKIVTVMPISFSDSAATTPTVETPAKPATPAATK